MPKLVWFYFDGSAVFVYIMPDRGEGRPRQRHPQVSLNLDSDGNGGGIVVDRRRSDRRRRGRGLPRRRDRTGRSTGRAADQFGLTESMVDYSTRLRISIDKVWTTPTA